jgi:hypothetical protein
MPDKTSSDQTPNTSDQTPNASDLSRGDNTPLQGSQRLDQAPFPKGIYIVNGTKVNADGEEIDDEGTVLKKGNK